MVAAFLLVLLIIGVVTIFSVQNAMPVAISFLTWKFEASLAIIVFLSVLGGLFTGIIITALYRLRSRRRSESDMTEGRTTDE